MKYILLILLLFPFSLKAEPVASASHNGITITLFDEGCKSQNVKNLPYRALWKEGKGSFEGCYGVASGAVVMLYFEDKTVVVLPVQAFSRTTGV